MIEASGENVSSENINYLQISTRFPPFEYTISSIFNTPTAGSDETNSTDSTNKFTETS